MGPGDHAGHHQPHRAGGVGAERDAAQVQPVVGDRQPVAPLRNEQVLRRHAEIVEDDALVVGVLERVQAVLAKLKVLVLLLRQIDDQHRRALSIRQTRPIVRPGTTLVMNSFSPLTT